MAGTRATGTDALHKAINGQLCVRTACRVHVVISFGAHPGRPLYPASRTSVLAGWQPRARPAWKTPRRDRTAANTRLTSPSSSPEPAPCEGENTEKHADSTERRAEKHAEAPQAGGQAFCWVSQCRWESPVASPGCSPAMALNWCVQVLRCPGAQVLRSARPRQDTRTSAKPRADVMRNEEGRLEGEKSGTRRYSARNRKEGERGQMRRRWLDLSPVSCPLSLSLSAAATSGQRAAGLPVFISLPVAVQAPTQPAPVTGADTCLDKGPSGRRAGPAADLIRLPQH